MEQKLLEKLQKITPEEQRILDKKGSVEKSLYTSDKRFVIDRNKMLEKGKLIDIRTHTRFVHFPQHSHNYIEIIYMCSGSTTHIINQETKVVLEQGDLLFLNQNATHEIKMAGKDDIAVNFIVMPEFFDVAFEMVEEENVVREFFTGALQKEQKGIDYIHFHVADILPIQNLVENMIWALVYKEANRKDINKMTMGLLIMQLANHIDRIAHQNSNQEGQKLTFTILQYIEQNYKEGSLAELAQILHCDIYWLSKEIKKLTGCKYTELVQKKRLNQAAYLLKNTKLSVMDVGMAVGYENLSYFHRIFQKEYGLTPRHYRVGQEK
ncbi:MAG: helix-turn-helix domain-containing protein [Lachnospiraceae bacterium]|nr:helix-turn-helix domain-containing protein [Lachnospiraceae bacterium]